MEIKGSPHIGIVVDIVAFLSAIVLIWGMESVRLGPLRLSAVTLRFIMDIFSIQAVDSGTGMLLVVIFGLIYAALLSLGVVFVFRRIRRNRI